LFPLSVGSKRQKAVERIILFLNRDVVIKTFPCADINKLNWDLNKRAVAITDELENSIRRSTCFNIIIELLKDEAVLKYYKMRLVNHISDRLVFFGVAKDKIKEIKSDFYIIPSAVDEFALQAKLFGEFRLDHYILPGCWSANEFRNSVKMLFSLFLFALLPLLYLLFNIHKVKTKTTKNAKYDIAMPVIWGLHEGDVIIGNVKFSQDDSYLYNRAIKKGNIIHMFNFSKFSPEVLKKYKAIMTKRHIPYVERSEYRIGVNMLLTIVKSQKKIARYWRRLFLFGFRDKYEYLRYSITAVYEMLKKYLELENVEYKVEFVRTDYDPGHIVGTIICNKNNRKTVGIQHNASPYSMPWLSYVHMDKYIVYGDNFVRRFSPHWQNIRLAKTGRENIDYVVNIANDRKYIEKLRRRLRMKYSETRHTVLITFPGGDEKNLRKQWDEMYDALCSLRSFDIDLNLFLRFRNVDHLEHFEHLKRFKELPLMDARIHIDHDSFSTHELMAISDLYIAGCASFGISEAIAIMKNVFTFSYMGIEKYYFGEYGSDFILYDRDDVLKVFAAIERGFQYFDCKWDLLRKDCNYHCDGNNLKRIQDVVWETVEEIDANNHFGG